MLPGACAKEFLIKDVPEQSRTTIVYHASHTNTIILLCSTFNSWCRTSLSRKMF